MRSETSPAAIAAVQPAAKGGGDTITSIAEDRLEGVAAIGRFIDPGLSEREVRRLLEDGHYPCWREGRSYVASKSALLAHWREMTATTFSPKGPARKDARRGYNPARGVRAA